MFFTQRSFLKKNMAIINLIISKLSTIKYKVINDKLVYVDNIVDTRTPG